MLFFIIVIFLGSFYLVNVILAIVAMSYDDCQKQDKIDADLEAEEEANMEEDDEFNFYEIRTSSHSSNTSLQSKEHHANHRKLLDLERLSIRSEYTYNDKQHHHQTRKSVHSPSGKVVSSAFVYVLFLLKH